MGSGNPQNILNMVVGTGQSLAMGYEASPVVSGSAVYGSPLRAAMFSLSGASGTGVRCGVLQTSTPVALNPAWLTGLTGIYESADSDGMGETIGSGFLNSVNDKLIHQMLYAEFGLSATAYSGIKKGTQPYANILIAVQKAIALATALSSPRTLLVRAATLTHGETDVQDGTTQAQYEADILQLQQNLTADAAAFTGQSQLVAMFLDQVASWTAYGLATSGIPLAQLAATLDNPDRVFLVCPKYFLTYYSGDGIHLTAHSEEVLGEYYAKAYFQSIIRGIPWKPVYPVSIVLTDSTHITIAFNVPVAPLVLDTTLVSDPGSKGFEYTDNSSPPGISSVAVQNGNQIVLTMSGAITATAGNRTVRYA